VFTRKWVPELAEVPDALLQAPWGWEGAARILGKRYPEPIVDVAAAARGARDEGLGRAAGWGFRAEAARIVEKHASRKDGGAGRHFVNDREARGRRSDARQLKLDL
jgi:deoxyribodipyrimidine photo-lyase